MPIFFSDHAPTCPLSIDQTAGERSLRVQQMFNRPLFQRPTVPQIPPHAAVNDVVQIVNLTRSIVQSAAHVTVRNNVFDPNIGDKGFVAVAADKYKIKKARWVEQTSKRIKRKYKYFEKTESGNENKDTYVTMERIERMVWYDSGWKTYMTWEYGDKGEGEPVGS
jgi:hypothetical protein